MGATSEEYWTSTPRQEVRSGVWEATAKSNGIWGRCKKRPPPSCPIWQKRSDENRTFFSLSLPTSTLGGLGTLVVWRSLSNSSFRRAVTPVGNGKRFPASCRSPEYPYLSHSEPKRRTFVGSRRGHTQVLAFASVPVSNCSSFLVSPLPAVVSSRNVSQKEERNSGELLEWSPSRRLV